MSEPVKRYGIFKRLLDSESYCRRAVARGNQDKFRVNMVLASVYDRDIKTRDKQIEGLIKADDAQMAEISEQAETIKGWKSWHRELSGIFGCRFVERTVTLNKARQQAETITRLQIDGKHIADLEAGTERLNGALTVLVDINSDRMTQAEWDRYNAALKERSDAT